MYIYVLFESFIGLSYDIKLQLVAYLPNIEKVIFRPKKQALNLLVQCP